jgi:5-methyltetrahydropteroyltriglutamate--homocysteine methyltransferase
LNIQATMVGSWFRPHEILELIAENPRGEIDLKYKNKILAAERRAIRDQMHPLESQRGLDWVSNGEQRKVGYTGYLPNRFYGFSTKERSRMSFSENLIKDIQESNPTMFKSLTETEKMLALPKLVDKLQYTGKDLAREEAEDAARLAKEEKASRIFISSASPGVTTIFFPARNVYRDHLEYLFEVAKEIRKEYRTILGVDAVDLQIDAPDLAMGYHLATDWGMDFYEALPKHIDAINQAIEGFPREKIRVHYCYGNYLASHKYDVDFSKILPELLRLKVGTIIGETANPAHEGDALVLEVYIKEHGWPKDLNFAAGVINVKTLFVESPRTVAMRLKTYAEIGIPPENLLAGTDCGFETFAGSNNIPYKIGLQKLKAEAEGAALASKILELEQ